MVSWFQFFKESLNNISELGTVCPSSSHVAKSILHSASQLSHKSKILEVGAGTGAITLPLVKALKPQQYLSVCELNTNLFKVLKSKIGSDPQFKLKQKQIDWHNCAIQDLAVSEKYDLIICSLPLLCFDSVTLEDILNKFISLSDANTTLTYVECAGVRRIIKVFKHSKASKRIFESEQLLQKKRHLVPSCTTRVWLNLPPLDVYSVPVCGIK